MHKWAKSIAECVKTKVEGKGLDNLELKEVEELELWTRIAKNLVCYDKDYKIVEAMEKSENEDNMDMIERYTDYPEKKYYRSKTSGRYMSASDGRRNNGRYYEEHYPDMMYDDEYMRDMDKKNGKMYYTASNNGTSNANMNGNMSSNSSNGSTMNYTEPITMREHMGNDSRYDRNRKHFEESKMEGKDDMVGLEMLMNTIKDDVKELTPKMSAQEKTLTKQKLKTMMEMLG